MKTLNNCSKCGFSSECHRINFVHNEEFCKWHFVGIPVKTEFRPIKAHGLGNASLLEPVDIDENGNPIKIRTHNSNCFDAGVKLMSMADGSDVDINVFMKATKMYLNEARPTPVGNKVNIDNILRTMKTFAEADYELFCLKYDNPLGTIETLINEVE